MPEGHIDMVDWYQDQINRLRAKTKERVRERDFIAKMVIESGWLSTTGAIYQEGLPLALAQNLIASLETSVLWLNQAILILNRKDAEFVERMAELIAARGQKTEEAKAQ